MGLTWRRRGGSDSITFTPVAEHTLTEQAQWSRGSSLHQFPEHELVSVHGGAGGGESIG